MATKQEKIDKAWKAYNKAIASAWEAYKKVEAEAKDD